MFTFKMSVGVGDREDGCVGFLTVESGISYQVSEFRDRYEVLIKLSDTESVMKTIKGSSVMFIENMNGQTVDIIRGIKKRVVGDKHVTSDVGATSLS